VVVDIDLLDRIQKLALDSGDAATLEEAAAIFSRYVLQVDVCGDGLDGSTAEATFGTILNAAPRAFQGGVRVRLAQDRRLESGWVKGQMASDAIAKYGCEQVSALDDNYPTLVLGTSPREWPTGGRCMTVTHAGWSGGVLSRPGLNLRRRPEFPPAGVAAGAIGVAEAFQIIRGNVRAGRRDQGLSLWRPEVSWVDPSAFGPDISGLLAPNKLHVLGLGHLGQAYIWTLGWLPFEDPAQIEIVLQDVDLLTKANLATSLLATESEIERKKTRIVADAAEELGFTTRLYERRFDEHQRIGEDDPQIALVGVDNPHTRAALGQCGWSLIVDVGLGAGAGDYLDARLHSFPADRTPEEQWGGRSGTFDETVMDLPAYHELERRLGDRCGAIMVAGRAVGAAFVGAFASSVAIAELLRYYADDDRRHSVVDVSLRDLSRPRIACASDWPGAENLGYIQL
jgi:hypothetical protein